jgi:hypothetical protein
MYCLSGIDRGFLGRRSVSLTTYHLLGPPEVCPSTKQTKTKLLLLNYAKKEIIALSTFIVKEEGSISKS